MPKLEGALERGELGSPGLGGLVHKMRGGGVREASPGHPRCLLLSWPQTPDPTQGHSPHVRPHLRQSPGSCLWECEHICS